jgi:hypothetical protein
MPEKQDLNAESFREPATAVILPVQLLPAVLLPPYPFAHDSTFPD